MGCSPTWFAAGSALENCGPPRPPAFWKSQEVGLPNRLYQTVGLIRLSSAVGSRSLGNPSLNSLSNFEEQISGNHRMSLIAWKRHQSRKLEAQRQAIKAEPSRFLQVPCGEPRSHGQPADCRWQWAIDPPSGSSASPHLLGKRSAFPTPPRRMRSAASLGHGIGPPQARND